MWLEEAILGIEEGGGTRTRQAHAIILFDFEDIEQSIEKAGTLFRLRRRLVVYVAVDARAGQTYSLQLLFSSLPIGGVGVEGGLDALAEPGGVHCEETVAKLMSVLPRMSQAVMGRMVCRGARGIYWRRL